jgi:predicted MFS family arabinose efflux permease
MTETSAPVKATAPPAPRVGAVHRRLRPLYLAVALQGMLLWIPVEKLFMNEIGFTAASVGVMAAAYAAVTPLLEVPSGILADRWSRRGVLVLSAVALLACTLVGGLSTGVPMYIASAMLLGVYFAMYSGTVESIVYDLVLEETGSGDSYQRHIGRVRALESAALVGSSLAGGWLAGLAGPRATYFVTLPFAALSVLAYLRFREPALHRTGERDSLRDHVVLTFRTIVRRGDLLPIVVLGALTALIAQVIFEFGPLWLVALAAPAVLFGPYWAGLVSTLGLGGLIAGRIRLDRPVIAVGFAALMTGTGVLLSLSTSLAAVITAQVVLALLISIAGIHVSSLLHDAVPSPIRAGVASGVSTVSWIGFLPFALVFGWVTKEFGTGASGWMITASTVLAAALLIQLARRSRPRTGAHQ